MRHFLEEDPMIHPAETKFRTVDRLFYFAKYMILCVAGLIFLTSSSVSAAGATVSTEVASEIFQFFNKTIFMKYSHDDKMNLKPFVVDELEKMGFRFVTSEQDAEMIAMFRYDCNRDLLGLKLNRFRVKISDRKTGEKLAGGTSNVALVYMGTTEMMVREVFREIERELKHKETTLSSSGYKTALAENLPKPMDSPEMIAVADIGAAGLSKTEEVILSNYFRSVLERTAYFNILGVKEMNLLLSEQQNKPVIPCNQSCLMEMGKALGVSKMVGGSILLQGDTILINLDMIDTASGAVVVSFCDNIEFSAKLLNAMERAGHKLVTRYAALQN